MEYKTLCLQQRLKMMKNYDASVEITCNLIWHYIIDHLYMILTTFCSGSGKTNLLLNFIKHQQTDIHKTYICQRSIQIKVSITCQWKKKVEIKKLKNLKAFIDYS